MQWEPALFLVLAWLMVYLCILRGTASTGKVGGHSSGGRGPVPGRLPAALEGQKLCWGRHGWCAGTGHLVGDTKDGQLCLGSQP